MSVLVTIGVLALVAVWAMASYNTLVGLRNQVTNGWRQIDVQLKRRHDLIPNLVNTVQGAMEFERDTLEAVIAARNRAVSASGRPTPAARKASCPRRSGGSSRSPRTTRRCTANENVRALQEELSGTENKIGFARQFYNDIATKYNTATQVIPGQHHRRVRRLQAGRAVRDHRTMPSVRCRRSTCR